MLNGRRAQQFFFEVHKMRPSAVWSFVAVFVVTGSLSAQQCVDCHKKVTPNIVSDWQASKHSQNAVDCSVCHGDKHTSAADVARG